MYNGNYDLQNENSCVIENANRIIIMNQKMN